MHGSIYTGRMNSAIHDIAALLISLTYFSAGGGGKRRKACSGFPRHVCLFIGGHRLTFMINFFLGSVRVDTLKVPFSRELECLGLCNPTCFACPQHQREARLSGEHSAKPSQGEAGALAPALTKLTEGQTCATGKSKQRGACMAVFQHVWQSSVGSRGNGGQGLTMLTFCWPSNCWATPYTLLLRC